MEAELSSLSASQNAPTLLIPSLCTVAHRLQGQRDCMTVMADHMDWPHRMTYRAASVPKAVREAKARNELREPMSLQQ